jgi:hypothetical protein
MMKQPNNASQAKLNDLLEDGVDTIEIRGKRFSIGWIKKGVIRKLTNEIETCKNEDELSAKCASLVLLNNYWKIKLFHWIYWRYLWRKYSDEELLEVFMVAKKKVDLQTQAYLTNTIYLIGMKDTIMTMTKKEAERTLQELKQAQHSHTEKSTPN